MKKNVLIPLRHELSFLVKLIAVIFFGSACATVTLYFLLYRNLDKDYASVFQIIELAKNNFLYYLLIAILIQTVISSVIVFFTALYFSHKIAGPVYRLKAVMADLKSNRPVTKVTFRDDDFLKELAEIFTKILEKENLASELMTQAKIILSKEESKEGSSSNEIMEALNALKEKYKTVF